MWLKRALIFTIVYFIAVVLAMFIAGLTFGYGLGDLAYLYMQIAWIIILSITLSIVTNPKREVSQALAIIIMLILLFSIIYITREFTVNRGIESPWDGKVFP